MMTPISFQLLTPNDYLAYRRARLDCLKNFPENFGSTYEEESKVVVENFGESDCKYFFYGAFCEGVLIGISAFLREPRLKTRHRGDIRQVYVDPAFTGNGIAGTLIKRTIEKAFEDSSIEQITLSVVSANETAVNLYKRLGFVQYGLIENYFKKDDKYTSQIFMILTRQNYFLPMVP